MLGKIDHSVNNNHLQKTRILLHRIMRARLSSMHDIKEYIDKDKHNYRLNNEISLIHKQHNEILSKYLINNFFT